MSTQIAELKGKAGARDVELFLTQFYGGTKRGLCLQFTIVGRDYIQFNKAQVQGLVKELQNWLGEVELPWKSNGQIAFENYHKNTPNVNWFRAWEKLEDYQRRNWEEMFP